MEGDIRKNAELVSPSIHVPLSPEMSLRKSLKSFLISHPCFPAPARPNTNLRFSLVDTSKPKLPDKHPAKKILPISLRTGDGTFQPEELPENNLMWTQNARPTLYGQWLAWQMTVDHSIDPAVELSQLKLSSLVLALWEKLLLIIKLKH